MRYLTALKHEKTFALSEFYFSIGFEEKARLIREFANEHIITQKGKRRAPKKLRASFIRRV
jgi:hypothetical protein